MGNPSRNRARGSKEQPALQLSSYQLVMAICALLLLMCVLFIAGILVQRFTGDTAPSSTEANTSPKETSERISPSAASSQGEGRQVAPRPVTLPPESEVAAGAGAQSSTASTRNESNAKYIPAPPPRRDRGESGSTKPDSTESKPSTSPAVEDSAPVTQPAVEPVVPEAPTGPMEPAPATQETTEPATTSAATPTPEVNDAAPQANESAAAGPFTIQVASFDSNNLERAKRFKEETEAATGLTVSLVPSVDGKHVRAFVGEYADRAAADAARDEMRKVKGFEDCFVKSVGEE